MSEDKFEICLIPTAGSPARMETSITALNKPLADLLIHNRLPVDDILSPVNERKKVLQALESTLEILPIPERERASYLSKFTVAVAVGLFDGALNFLWDETIKALRSVVVAFDLQYFFKVAETVSAKYKGLLHEADLVAISEYDLLTICRRIGIITDVSFKRLEHVNYLRNHASAAHPNENSISGIEMLSNLETCLREAITAKPDHSIIQLKALLENIRKNNIPSGDFYLIGQDLANQPQERIDDFTMSLFGIYCDPRQEQFVKNNIEGLFPYIWNHVLEGTREAIGSKYGYHRNHGDNDRKEATHRILAICNGLNYKDEDSLAAELLEKLQILRTVHYTRGNFYNEFEHASSIGYSIPKSGVIPHSVKPYFVKVISVCFVGNGLGYKDGVDERAVPYYLNYINLFDEESVKFFLQWFYDDEFVKDFGQTKADHRIRVLAGNLKTKTRNVHAQKALDLIISFPPMRLGKISGDSNFHNATQYI